MKLPVAALTAAFLAAVSPRLGAGTASRPGLLLQSRKTHAGIRSRLPSQSGPGWGAGYHTPTKYFDQLKQIKRSMPAGGGYWGYDDSPPGAGGDQGDAPPGTTFDTKLAACEACRTFYPTKHDGVKFHDPEHNDANGGKWDQVCRVGLCNFRDPQTQPWAGQLATGSEAFQVANMEEWGSGWRGPQGKKCFTLDPVFSYEDCETLMKNEVKTAYDLTRYCSYQKQIFVPPPAGQLSPFAGVDHKSKWEAFTRLDSSREQCMLTISEHGPALWDNSSMCDSDIAKLSGCCETVFDSFHCMIMEGRALGVDSHDLAGFNATREAMAEGLALFKTYCIPLCQLSRPEYCQVYPTSDICVKYGSCAQCVEYGGAFNKQGDCVCMPPGMPAPECPSAAGPAAGPLAAAPAAAVTAAPLADITEPSCKYLEMEQVWSQAQDFTYR